MDFLSSHEAHNLMTLVQATDAAARGEVPVGALIYAAQGWVVSMAGNGPIGAHDPMAHAEIVAMRCAARRLSNYRLSGLCMVVSLEPCPVCQQATGLARLQSVRYLTAQGAENGFVRPDITPPLQEDRAFMTAGEMMLKIFFEFRR
ncbi:nucleoside deaminase [Magnetococcus marinus]|uniref:nucleoside deaminase n=1 Tax=Magnetococcus marinus TaxID=1124597 RepID=UPI001D0F5E50|nr:nucleoside deaminase [Magnetococcus marinus]